MKRLASSRLESIGEWLADSSFRRSEAWFYVAAAAVCAMLLFPSCGSRDTHLAMEGGKTVVERYGYLQVLGTDLCNEAGEKVQLRGMSSHGLQWHGKYCNEDVLRFLRDDWNVQLWRCAMYVSEGGYAQGKGIRFTVIDGVEAAIKLGMYVIIDWHVLSDKDPLLYQSAAEEFFYQMSSTYGDVPNVIYEICNEPNGDDVTWEGNIKPYAEDIIPIIRERAPKSIIIVGTPQWSSDLRSAWESPIEGQTNIMYTRHFYAGSTQEAGRQNISEALKHGIAVFVTEWGTTLDSGDGGVFEKETLDWTAFMEKNNISWANWSVNNKGEDSGVLKYNKDRGGKGGWTDDDLSPSGLLLRRILRGKKWKPSAQ